MDISFVDNSSVKIRLRQTTFVVDPAELGSKISSDAIILLDRENNPVFKTAPHRIVINGPGEYELSGVKVLGIKVDKGFVYGIADDGFGAILGKTSEISKIKDKTFSCQIAILNVDDNLNQSVVTRLEPKIVVLYGANKENGAKTIGKENLTSIKKFTTTKDKLPQEMEVVILG